MYKLHSQKHDFMSSFDDIFIFKGRCGNVNRDTGRHDSVHYLPACRIIFMLDTFRPNFTITSLCIQITQYNSQNANTNNFII